jgi:RNA polymerase sigma-70 factor (ECF subfamily)
MARSDSKPAPRAGHFATTQWSCVLAARDRSSPGSREALASLCAIYWYPLFVYARRRCHDAEQARDLTQEFFARLLEKDFLKVVDRDKGKFRTFLLAAFQHFLLNEFDRARARKRGGDRLFLSLDLAAAEERYHREPAHELTPEKLFERRWALTLLEQVLTRLETDMARTGKGLLFARLKDYLMREKTAPSYSQIAAELGLSVGAVKVAVHRLRKRYKEMLRQEIERTVHEPEQIEEEIRALFAALG